jgi:hypothetical protein
LLPHILYVKKIKLTIPRIITCKREAWDMVIDSKLVDMTCFRHCDVV